VVVSAPAATAAPEAPAESKPRPGWRRTAPLVVAAAAILALVALRAFVAEPFRITSESMAPTLRPGDQALVTKVGGASHRGDLVAFHSARGGEIMLKRIVGVGGDEVGLEDGVLVVNGRKQREEYADADAIDSVYFGPVKVARGSVFVLGDNRANSEDSREFGAVPEKSIIGHATARVWPPGRWGATG
jgi:signal peptidase I